MNLAEILGLQPKGVNALSFSSRKRLDQVQNDDAGCIVFTLSRVLSHKETFAKPTVIPRGSGNLWEAQLERATVCTRYCRSDEFCKGLHKGEGILPYASMTVWVLAFFVCIKKDLEDLGFRKGLLK